MGDLARLLPGVLFCALGLAAGLVYVSLPPPKDRVLPAFASFVLLYGTRLLTGSEVLRRATIVLGMLVGNHLLSAVDAMISARLKARVPPAPIEVRMQQDIYGVWFLTLQIPH